MTNPNTQLRRRAENDVDSRANKILTNKSEASEPELERIRETLIEHRNNRDTTNLPEVERASQNSKVEAIRRRMKTKRYGTEKNRQSGNATKKNETIPSSGTPDSVAGSGGGDGDSGGSGGSPM